MVDIEQLRRLWIAGVPANEIARHLGIRRPAMHELRRLHGIADRENKYTKRIVDPTPDEIEERARECREKRPVPPADRVEARQFSWNGRAFDAIA